MASQESVRGRQSQQEGKAKMEGNTWPLEDEANVYLDNHRILELFNNMTSQLIYNRPDDPKTFMIKMLEKLEKSRTTRLDFPCLFDDSNVQAVFGMLDPTNKGHITFQQYKEAMTTLGITGYDNKPMGLDLDEVTFETFLREAKLGLTRASATFHSDSSSSSLH